MKKKEDETYVTNIKQEVLGDDEDFRTSISKMLRIGRHVLQENQDKPVDSLGGAAPVANDRNDQEKIRPVRITFTDADQKKKNLAALRETINESRSGKYKYIFFLQDLTRKQREIAKERELLELQPVKLKKSRESREPNRAPGIVSFIVSLNNIYFESTKHVSTIQ